jgi:cellulose biosynthesis protein BcsQ
VKIDATDNIKGGGTTSAAVNLAHLAARNGQRALLWDLDLQGAATYLLRVRPKVKGGSKALIGARERSTTRARAPISTGLTCARGFHLPQHGFAARRHEKPTRRIRQLLAPLVGEYDVVFLDCPPSISLPSENVLHAVDTVLVPVPPTTLSARTFDQLVSFVDDFDGRRAAA